MEKPYLCTREKRKAEYEENVVRFCMGTVFVDGSCKRY